MAWIVHGKSLFTCEKPCVAPRHDDGGRRHVDEDRRGAPIARYHDCIADQTGHQDIIPPGYGMPGPNEYGSRDLRGPFLSFVVTTASRRRGVRVRLQCDEETHLFLT